MLVWCRLPELRISSSNCQKNLSREYSLLHPFLYSHQLEAQLLKNYYKLIEIDISEYFNVLKNFEL